VQVEVTHVDPLKIELARDLRRRYPVSMSDPTGVAQVIRTGRSEHFPDITDDMLVALVPDAELLRTMRKLKLRSSVVVPLAAGARVLGAVTMVFAESGRRYTEDDLAFAEEVGRRAATAIENARLYAAEQRARDAADAASRAKDEFLALVSHELRTPLSAILGWAQILSRAPDDAQRRARAVATIERNAVAMTQLIDDLLDVSRIVNGKLRLDVDSVHLPAIIDAALESLRPAADAKSITVEKTYDPDAGAVHGDPARLQQVVWNLVSNAVKFTPPGGRVAVSLARRGAHVEIAVADNGKGIEPRFLPHVFEAFRQADASKARSAGGLGLGLAIVKLLVELHGGHVDAQSEGEGRGATFTVRLPLPAERPMTRGVSRITPVPGEGTAPRLPQLAGLRVLAVEDEPDMRELLRDMLVEWGCAATTAGSVAEAMQAFERGPAPDILLSDISMPGETGYDLIRRVRALPAERGGHVPAAALTAYTRAEDRRSVLSAGFDVHVPKPIEPAELASVLATRARFTGRHEGA
jgi:signal transduction histidine kinase